jgi:hypothetical protein
MSELEGQKGAPEASERQARSELEGQKAPRKQAGDNA